MSRQVTDLERRGLLERVADPDRPATQILRVTPAGRKRIEAAARQQRTVLDHRLESPADLRAFAGYLERFNAEE